MDLEDGFEYRNTQPSRLNPQYYVQPQPLQYQPANYMTSPQSPSSHHALPHDDFQRLPTDNSIVPPSNTETSYGMSSPHSPTATTPADSYGPSARAIQATPAVSDNRSAIRRFFAAYKTKNQLIFLALIVAQSAAVLTMIGLLYGTVNDGIGDLSFDETFAEAPQLESIATYMSLFILACFFELFVTLDALQEKNILSLCFLLAFQIAMVIYSSFLPSQIVEAIRGSNADTSTVRHEVRAYSIVIPCVIAAFTLAMMWLVWRLYEEFGWNLYKSLGADLKIKRMYALYQAFVCVVKFDIFVFLGFCIQFLVLVTGTPTVEFVLTIAALPIILVVLLVGAIFVRREFTAGAYVFLVFQLAGMAYFVYKLVRIYDDSSADRYAAATKTLTLFAVIALIFLIGTFVLTCLCMQNFDRGLRERIPGYRWAGSKNLNVVKASKGEKAGGDPASNLVLGRAETRMSLD